MQWIIYGLCLLLTPLAASSSELTQRQGHMGMWVWRPGPLQDEGQAKALVDFCRAQGFDTILLQMHYVPESDPPVLDYQDGLRRLLALTAQAGIKVESLNGASSMALAEIRRNDLAKLDAVLAFQATQSKGQGFSAIHFDIEPYTLPEWKEGNLAQRRAICREMLETFTLLRNHLHAGDKTGMALKFDIPSWYDDAHPELALDFGGATKHLSEHIQDIADEIVIMSYRRKPNGANSAESLAADEMAYAAKIGKTVGLALETIELKSDPQISFFGAPASEFRAAVHQIFSDLGGKPGFGGLYLHQYDRLREYLPETEPLYPPTP